MKTDDIVLSGSDEHTLEFLHTQGFIHLIKGAEEGKLLLPCSLRALACMRLIKVVKEISDKNYDVFIKPENGDIKVVIRNLENDTIPYKSPNGTNWSKVGYGLAINMAYILIGSHPYKGRKWFEAPLITRNIEENLFINNPEFILATDSKAPNAPHEVVQSHVKLLYNSLTPWLRERFKSAFNISIGEVWFSADGKNDELINMYNHLWEIVCTSVAKDRKSISIKINGYPYFISSGKKIVTPDILNVIAHCEEYKNKLIIVNDTSMKWRIECVNKRLSYHGEQYLEPNKKIYAEIVDEILSEENNIKLKYNNI